MQSINGIGFLTITGPIDCACHSWSIKWNDGGDKKQINVDINFS